MGGTKTGSGRELNIRWGVGATLSRYHKDGSWFMPLDRFPGALFDTRSYVLFRTEDEYLSCEYLRIGDRLHVSGGISGMPSYKRMR